MSEEKVDYVVDGVTRPSCEADLPNLFGWDGAIARSKKWEAKMNLMHSADESMFHTSYLALYNDKYEVEALNLDHVLYSLHSVKYLLRLHCVFYIWKQVEIHSK